MPRRANSGVPPQTIAIGVVALVALALVGWRVIGRRDDPFAGVTPLDAADYLTNAKSLMGNVYTVRGTVSEQLRWTPQDGRLFSVLVGTPGDESPLAIKVPQEFSSQNIQTGQEFVFKVEVGRGGVLIARGLQKS
jgi:hypothetical protein